MRFGIRRARHALLFVSVGTTIAIAINAYAQTGISDAGLVESIGGCVEQIPSGMQRPVIMSSFPAKGMSGYAVTIKVDVEHGKGETVLPHGLELQASSEAAKELATAGFTLPDQDGGAHARLTANPAPRPDRASTTIELPLLVLPKEPGRHTFMLPRLPIAISRASGDIAVVCTRPHSIVIQDPTASTPEAEPKGNPAPRPQREEWSALKRALGWSALGVALGSILGFLIYRWMKRPKVVPPPPPPRPPWELALEQLDEVRHAGLLEMQRYGDYFDRVSDAVRAYLGARYDFDGLETTTPEMIRALQRAPVFGLSLPEVIAFLQECDLVKFANLTPTRDECERILAMGEHIVRSTTPMARVSSTPIAHDPMVTPSAPGGAP